LFKKSGCAYGAGFSINYNDASGAYAGVVFGIFNYNEIEYYI
jgi:hypothetical protein